MNNNIGFPRQALPFNKKGEKWAKQCVDFADSKSFMNYSVCRKSYKHKKINYDLVNGKLHMKDLMDVINPEEIQSGYVPEKIQHYPIINSKMNVLKGEESKRVFDYRAIVTNPTAVSEIENNKKMALQNALQQWIENKSQSEDEASQELDRISDYFTYDWQDIREMRCNFILRHYSKEQDFDVMFNEGFVDAETVGEEMYQCDIVGGEPVVYRLDPLKVRVLKSGYSNRIEDADIIIIEDYWSPGKIIDTFYDVLSQNDIKKLESFNPSIDQGSYDEFGNYDPRPGLINADQIDDSDVSYSLQEGLFSSVTNGYTPTQMPYDYAGNIRVLRVYWKSKRRIKKIKYYDENGEEQFDFKTEQYIADKDRGEEETILYVNEAWEGTKIGKDIYVNMRPRLVQYNSLSNPSKCHFGIIGSIYNINGNKPFSLVDMMKPYAYAYDVYHDRLNKLIARNWGTLVTLDLAKVPKGWDIDKVLFYAKTMGLNVVDSFKEGNIGASTGKLAGGLNNNSTGVIAASDANDIQQYINILEYISNEMSSVVGITKQREGQISNRETVGGVERSTLQSSHITEWLFITHENLKKRVLTAFLETAKIAMRGNSRKFQYILSDGTQKIMDIDGDEFAECDYGIVVDNSETSQKLNQQIETLAQAALQNQTLSFSTIMKLYSSASIAEKERMVQKDEEQRQQQAQQAQQQQAEQAQQELQQKAQSEEAQRQQEYQMNQEDNETKIIVAQINAQSKNDAPIEEKDDTLERDKFEESKRQFNENLSFLRNKSERELALKKQQINKASKSTK